MRFLPGDKILWMILLVALVVRIGAGLWWQSKVSAGERFYFGDSESYWQLAGQIATGLPYQFETPDRKVFRAPGLPTLFSPLHWAFGDNRRGILFARGVSAVFGVFATGGVYCLARGWFDIYTARIAAAIAAVYPGSVAMGGLVLSESPFMAAMIWQLVAWQRSASARSPASVCVFSGIAGVLAGFATLIRPSWLLFTPLLAGAAIVVCRKKNYLLRSATIVTSMILVMAPWWVRNWQVTGHFVPTTLQVGASLYDGLNPQADGGSDMTLVDDHVLQHLQQENLSEFQLDRALRTAAIDWAREHPADAAQLAWTKLVRMWNVWPNEPSFRSWTSRLVVAGTYLPVMLLAIGGAWQWRQRFGVVAICLAPAIYFTALHLVFVSSLRYRQPAMLPLIVLAAAALVSLSVRRYPTPKIAS